MIITAYSRGILYSRSSNITIEASEFTAYSWGGVLRFLSSTNTIEASKFHNNTAYRGGVLTSQSSNITTEASEFDNNAATIMEEYCISQLAVSAQCVTVSLPTITHQWEQ